MPQAVLLRRALKHFAREQGRRRLVSFIVRFLALRVSLVGKKLRDQLYAGLQSRSESSLDGGNARFSLVEDIAEIIWPNSFAFLNLCVCGIRRLSFVIMSFLLLGSGKDNVGLVLTIIILRFAVFSSIFQLSYVFIFSSYSREITTVE